MCSCQLKQLTFGWGNIMSGYFSPGTLKDPKRLLFCSTRKIKINPNTITILAELILSVISTVSFWCFPFSLQGAEKWPFVHAYYNWARESGSCLCCRTKGACCKVRLDRLDQGPRHSQGHQSLQPPHPVAHRTDLVEDEWTGAR